VTAGDGPEAGAVARVIDRASIPGRHGSPRLAEQLAGTEQIGVETPHGLVAAWRVGNGPATVLVHGWRDSARLWDPLMGELVVRTKPFVVLDLPGHGFSGGERCLTNEVPDAVIAVASALGPVDSAVAHSFACGGTARAVAEGLPAERLVLIAPPLAYRRPGEAAGDAADGAHQRWRRIAAELGYDPGVGDRALETYLATIPPHRARFDLVHALADLPAAVLLLASVDDERFDIASARSLVERQGVTLVELTGLDHRASARDAAAVHAIADFVTRGSARPPGIRWR
jgi:pimeloyl-ACP methyl ester carboxylesterase